LVIVTPDPSSLTDAYALIKVLNQKYKTKDFSVVCNLMKDEKEALQQFKNLSDVAMKFLNVRLDYKGFVPLDLNLRRATKSQQLVLNYQPRCPSSFAIRQLGENIKKKSELYENKGGVQVFWQQLVGVA
jgi:flagellar biosynthesis protein FlhG